MNLIDQDLNVSDLVIKAQVLAGGRGKGHFAKVSYLNFISPIRSYRAISTFYFFSRIQRNFL
jgi:hypothetical protein